jgi:hypothetical protein
LLPTIGRLAFSYHLPSFWFHDDVVGDMANAYAIGHNDLAPIAVCDDLWLLRRCYLRGNDM